MTRREPALEAGPHASAATTQLDIKELTDEVTRRVLLALREDRCECASPEVLGSHLVWLERRRHGARYVRRLECSVCGRNLRHRLAR